MKIVKGEKPKKESQKAKAESEKPHVATLPQGDDNIIPHPESLKKAEELVQAELFEAYEKKDIKLKRSLTAQKKVAPAGHIYYTIKYRRKSIDEHGAIHTVSMYDGAYLMTLEEEAHFIKINYLPQYILRKLVYELI
jgi:hypothetical protein